MAEARRTKEDAQKDHAKRVLLWLFVAILVLTGALGYGAWQKSASFTPKLGLDLSGGTQIILEPRLEGNESVSQEQLDEARDIIVQRIDSQGTTGAEVTTQGDSNIVVAMPGTPTPEQEEAIAASSQMQFRPVLATDIGSQEAREDMEQPAPSGSGSETSGSSGSETPAWQSSTSGSATSEESGSTSDGGAQSIQAPAEPSEPSATSSPRSQTSGSPSPSGSESSAPAQPGMPGQPQPVPSTWEPTGEPEDAMDPNNISASLWKKFQSLDCSNPPEEKPSTTEDEAIVACGQDGQMKYVLGPVVVPGQEIADAEAGYQVSPQGAQTNTPEISLTLTSEGRGPYGDISQKMVGAQDLAPTGQNPPGRYNALASTLDSQVLTAPGFNEAITNGRASITGFDIEEARALAESLKFGSLPLSFDVETRQEISPTLGAEQLRYGIIAGIIGLLVVFGYALQQYRALSVVVVGSMVIAFSVTYLAIALLAWGYNYRLDMAGVTGLIIAIGTTADSFIVYFERVRDELREGRNLRAAVEAGWARAKGTILVADGVNFVAAAILYLLASSGVRGFAFTLGLTTLIDLAIFWLFTHPMLTILARRKFFASGHKWSGFDVDRLREAKVRYKGRGSFDIENPATPGTAPAEGGA